MNEAAQRLHSRYRRDAERTERVIELVAEREAYNLGETSPENWLDAIQSVTATHARTVAKKYFSLSATAFAVEGDLRLVERFAPATARGDMLATSGSGLDRAR